MSVNKYDATTDTLTKVADNVDVLINDVTPSASSVYSSSKVESILPKPIYSTDEVKTNKVWINGKPIYRKHITLSTTYRVRNAESKYATIENAEVVTNLTAFRLSSHQTTNAVMGRFTDAGELYCWVYDSNIIVDAFCVEYTKTTD